MAKAVESNSIRTFPRPCLVAVRPKASPNNQACIDGIEILLEHARRGKVTGLAIAVVTDESTFYVDRLGTAGPGGGSAVFFRGALRCLDDELAKEIAKDGLSDV